MSWQTLEKLRSRRINAEEVLTTCHTRIEKLKELNAFITVLDSEDKLNSARKEHPPDGTEGI